MTKIVKIAYHTRCYVNFSEFGKTDTIFEIGVRNTSKCMGKCMHACIETHQKKCLTRNLDKNLKWGHPNEY